MSQNLKNHTEGKLGSFKTRLALDPSEEPQSDPGSGPNLDEDSNKQVGVDNNSLETIGDPLGVAKSPGLFVNGVENKVPVLSLGESCGG